MSKTNKNELTQKLERKSINEIKNGDIFGLWTVTEINNRIGKNSLRYCIVKCNCGTEKEIVMSSLINGRSTSCGCQLSEMAVRQFTTHNQSDSRLYSIYRGMKQRCYNKKHSSYPNYGARGIIICDEWMSSFENFYQWAMKHGYHHDLTIDRINTNGNYEPSNCQWLTLQEQQTNKNNTVYVNYKGDDIILGKLLKELGLFDDRKVIAERVRNGIPIEIAISLKSREDVFKYRFKEKVMNKLSSLQTREYSLTGLAKEVGVSRPVLIRWYKEDDDIVQFLSDNNITIKIDRRAK